MTLFSSILLDFSLPNATTWFYFSLLLALALFFKFSRLLSLRNWDVVTLFLLTPGLLLLLEARQLRAQPDREKPAQYASLIAGLGGAPQTGIAGLATPIASKDTIAVPSPSPWLAYLWLQCASLYLLLRCLLDLALVQRPALAPNLSFSGLACLALSLFIALAMVAYRPAREASTQVPPQVEPAQPVQTTAPLQVVQRPLDGRFWLQRTFALLCHLSVCTGLVIIGVRHFQDPAAGMAMATFYLMLPYIGMHVGQVEHVWPMALTIWAIAAYRLPTLAGVFLGIAAAMAFVPALLLPLWISFYWGRGAGRFTASALLSAGLCGLALCIALWSEDWGQLVQEALALPDWQPWKVPESEGFWTGVHWAYRFPVFIVYVTFLLTTLVWPAPKSLAHLLALSAALLIGLQFWYAHQGGTYVLWYLPLVLLLVFRPNLAERRPPPIVPETDWVRKLGRRLRRLVRRVLKAPETVVQVRS